MTHDSLSLSFAAEPSGLSGADLSARDRDYVSQAQPAFENLRQAVNLLAGLMLISRAVRRHGFVAADLRTRAEALLDEARRQIARLRPGPRSRHHCLHLRNAIARIEDALAESCESSIGLEARDRALPALKAAWGELIHASNALPGFDRVDLSQSCCAQHFAARKSPTILSCEGAPQ
jgi:hypothetical protein